MGVLTREHFFVHLFTWKTPSHLTDIYHIFLSKCHTLNKCWVQINARSKQSNFEWMPLAITRGTSIYFRSSIYLKLNLYVTDSHHHYWFWIFMLLILSDFSRYRHLFQTESLCHWFSPKISYSNLQKSSWTTTVNQLNLFRSFQLKEVNNVLDTLLRTQFSYLVLYFMHYRWNWWHFIPVFLMLYYTLL